MMTNNAPLIDSNILLYAASRDSHFYSEAIKVLEQYITSGLYLADINLVEFFQVITDGRKTTEPYSPDKASEFIFRLTQIPCVQVLKSRTLQEILTDETSGQDIANLSITRFGIYDYLIADCMRINQITTIITGNDKDFKKYDYIQAINPFESIQRQAPSAELAEPDTMHHAQCAMHTIPYGKQSINEKDIAAVCSVLRSDMITQGPRVPEFERAVANKVNAKHAVAVNSGTSALHLACRALGLGPGDILWTSPITFVASANCARYCGANVDFVDIDPHTYNISVQALKAKLQEAERSGQLPKAVVPVHMCGQSCDMQAIHELSRRYDFYIIEDACHALGGRYQNEPVGNCRYSDITVFSFHPVKIITTGEGGMAVTNNAELAERMALLRNHGITRDWGKYGSKRHPDVHTPIHPYSNTPIPPYTHTPIPSYYYEQIDLGYNYRMTDIQAALGFSQLSKLDEFVSRRRELAKRYNKLLQGLPMSPPWQHPDCDSAWHLYVIRLNLEKTGPSRRQIFENLREKGIGVNVHYIPVHTQPYYRGMGHGAGRMGQEQESGPHGMEHAQCAKRHAPSAMRQAPGQGMFPEAEKYYQEALTLPLFPAMSEADQYRVVDTIKRIMPTEHSERHGI